MSLYKKPDHSERIRILSQEIEEIGGWQRLAGSEHGKFLAEFLTKAMEETMTMTDSDADFKSVRSKYQTLKALREKMLKSAEEISWRRNEIARLNKETR